MTKKKKIEVDGSQKTLFCCKMFGANQRPAAVVSTEGRKAGDPSPARRAASTENRGSAIQNGFQRAQPGQPVQGMAVEDRENRAELQHAIEAMQAATEMQSHAPPAASPQNFTGIATGKVKELQGKLNAEQLQAALAPTSPPVFLLAGAGTGKTTTLIARVWHMIAQGIYPRAWPPPGTKCAAVIA
jgi:chromosomal replication initiation ATPase DnaA